MRRKFDMALLVLFLLGGLLLRWNGIAFLADRLDYDEAYYGLDALSLVEHPRLVPFFPANFGRESGWMYVLAPAIAVLGPKPFTLRVVAVMTGFLTLAATYRLASETLGKRAALWSVAALGVLYWHVHLSHLAFRALLFPLVGTLAFTGLLVAHRTNRMKHWLPAGVLVGLLAYTYFSARLWLGLALLMQGWWIARDVRKRRGAVASLVASGLVLMPLLLFSLNDPQHGLGRVSDLAVSPDGLVENLRLWLAGWLYRGSIYPMHNLPGHPILDWPLAILFFGGLATLLLTAQRRALWIAGLAFLAVVPSLLSAEAPHYLRAIGLTIPIALIAGAGAAALDRGRLRYALLCLVLWSGVNTFRDFHSWAERGEFPNTPSAYLRHINNVMDVLATRVSGQMPVYLTTHTRFYPVFNFEVAQFDSGPLEILDFGSCIAGPAAPFVFMASQPPDADDPIAQWADVELLYADDAAPSALIYNVYKAIPRQASLSANFAGILEVGVLNSLPLAAQPGDHLRIQFRLTPLRPLDRYYSIFIHLYGHPTPYEGGPLWSQGDVGLCLPYPPPQWKPGQAITQEFDLAVPASIEPGEYTVAIGIYDSASGQRLPLVSPTEHPDYVEIHRLAIIQPGAGS